MPTPEQLARFYDDDKPSTPSAPATSRPSPPARTPSTPPARSAAQPSSAERRARFFDDMKPAQAPDAAADSYAAQRRRSEAFEAQRSARRQGFYDDDPSSKPAPTSAKPDATATPYTTAKPAPAGEAKAEAVALDDLAPPAGVAPDDATFTEFTKMAGELGLDGDKAGQLLALHQRALVAEAEGWRAASEADEEVMALVPVAEDLVTEFGTDELTDLFRTGVGAHPEVIRFIGRVSEALASARRRGGR